MYNQEIKGSLARLLATENLVVEHCKVSTASFNVETRVLTLPMWQKASETVYDLLVGHEVGHALYTPVDFLVENVSKDVINVVEDARIEKLIKRRYPGLARDFYQAYQELNKEDFFQIEDKDISKMSLIDRINLHFKVGAFALISFTEEEKQFIPMIAQAETFADVVVICQELMKYINEKKKEQEKVADSPAQEQSASDGGGMPQNDSSQEQGEEEKFEQGEGEDESFGSSMSDGASGPDEEHSETQKAFDENAEALNQLNSWIRDVEYVEVGENNLNEIVVPFKVIHQHIENHWEALVENRGEDIFHNSNKSYREFKSNAQKEVNYLVKEFECKKSADAYARASTSKTGLLDTKKLHTYRYNEDLFKKVTVLPDGKNHGMIFILDWSGSMGNILDSTVKQLMNLMWFCRKVQIPFELYAFTYEWTNFLVDSEYDFPPKTKVENMKLKVHNRTSLLNFVSSSAKTKDFEKAMVNLYRLSYYFGSRYFDDKYCCPMGCDLSGTPLNDSILTLNQLIPDFKKKTGSQKTTVCILTDGESASCQYSVVVRRHGDTYPGSRTFNDSCQLRDRKLGKTYKVSQDYRSTTQVLLQNLKDKFPDINLIGFRIGSTSDFNSYYKYVTETFWVDEGVQKKWRKDKSWEFNNVGYDSLYFLANNNLSSSTDFDIEEAASKAQITKAFKTMLKSKTTNKKILSSFATVVS